MVVVHPEMQIKAYMLTSFGALLVYDILCVFDREVEYIWSRPWTIGTFVYVFNRYCPLVDIFYLQKVIASHNTPELCHSYHKIFIPLWVTGMCFSEMILMIRTYAVWNRQRWVLILLLCLAVVVLIPAIGITRRVLATMEFNPTPSFVIGCDMKYISNLTFVFYILFFLVETIIIVLTMMKASHHLSQSRSTWVRQLYQYGLLFYIYMMLLNITNVMIPFLEPVAELKNIMTIPTRILHSIFCSRVILSILDRHPNHTSFRDRDNDHDKSTWMIQNFTSIQDDSLGTTSTTIAAGTRDSHSSA